MAAENDVDAEELPHLLLVGLADLHAEGVELVSEAPVDGAEIAREVHPATVERAFQDAHAELAREDVERGDVCGLVGERAHPVGGEEAGEDASVLVVGHAVHEGDAAEAEQLGNAVAPQQTQNVLLLEGGVRRVGEGVEEELQVALGPGVFVELAEDGQVEVAEAGEGFGSEEFQEEEVDALGEVRDVARTEGDADVTAGVVEPEDVLGGELALVELEVPAVAED